MVLVSLGLGLAYKIDAKQTTVSEWVELCHLLEEKNAQQAKANK
jgi:UDP-N-acetyl-D-mannosaminuronate dehydrogenase